MKDFFLIFILVLFVSCEKTPSDSATNETEVGKFMSLSVEEKTNLAPTEIFKAIFANNYEAFKADLINSDEFKFDTKNKEGDTALAIAIKLSRNTMIQDLITSATVHDLKIKNHEDRSFVSLLSEFNQIKAFDYLVQTYKNSYTDVSNFVDFNFSSLDFPDEHGKNAAHYAKSAAMIDRLNGSLVYEALPIGIIHLTSFSINLI